MLLLPFVGCAPLVAAPRFASVFTDGAILQHGVRVPVWGVAEPGERVTVTFGAALASATAGADGRWRVDLPPQEASSVGRTLSVASASGDACAATVSDVLVGEVWIVCGQSNASLPLWGGNPRYRDREGALVAALTDRPTVRYAVSNGSWTLEPQAESRQPIVWKRFSQTNLGDARGGSCCAYAVTFACALQDALKVPVGLVCAYSGSTPIETWIPREGFAAHDDLRDYLDLPRIPPEKWTDRARNDTFMRHGGFQQPSVMWNARLAPWCPYAAKGVLFYQGCSNSWNAERYLSLQHALYDSWSEKFENGDLRFRYVQVVPWPFRQNCTLGVSLAQAQFAHEQTNAAMVVVSDIGNNWDAHPADKGPVGRRLAALALARDYGFDIAADAPEARAARAGADGRVVVELAHAKELYVYNDDGTVDSPFELAGADGRWHRAGIQNVDKQGRLDGARLVLKAADVPAPQKVRYLQCAPWRSNVFNEMSLPLGVFTAIVRHEASETSRN